MNKKLFYLIVVVLVLALLNGYVSPLNKFMVGVFDSFVFAGSSKSSKVTTEKGGGKKKRQPVTFASSAEVISVDTVNNKFRGIGLAGSSTGQEFLYEEMDYDLSGAVIEDRFGAEKSIEDLIGVELVHVHGINYNNGTFTVNKVVIQE